MATLTLPAPRRLRSPLPLTLLVYAGNAVVIVAGALLAAALLPDADGLTRSLVASVAALAYTLVVARAVAVCTEEGWAGLGLNHPREWRDLRLLVVPALITLVPLLALHFATDLFAAIGGLPRFPSSSARTSSSWSSGPTSSGRAGCQNR